MPNQKNQNIVIHKNGDAKEKVTIVIDGDKITVNGKPMADYENKDLQIISDGNDFEMPPIPPMNGGVQMFDDHSPMHSNKAFLGVMSEKTDNGVKIQNITKESPAEKAGLQKNDIITKVNDEVITSPDDLYKAVGKFDAGDKTNITYVRNGKTNSAAVTLAKNSSDEISFNKAFHFKSMPRNYNYSYRFNNKPQMGIEVQETENNNGVKIIDVNDDDDAPAAKAGLKEGDIITSINDKAIKSVDDVHEALKDAKEGDVFTVQYLRDNKSQSAQVKFPKELKTTDL